MRGFASLFGRQNLFFEAPQLPICDAAVPLLLATLISARLSAAVMPGPSE